MAVRLFITILLLFHQISSSIQQSGQVDQFTSSIDRDEILFGDRRTLKNETQQELVETRGKICELHTEIARKRNETKDKDVEMSRLTAKMAQIEANLMGRIAETKRKNDDLVAQLRTQNTEVRDGKAKIGELEGKINALQSKISGFETQMIRTMTLALDPDGWSYLAKTASWYKVIVQEMTFDQAEAYCASRKGHLVTIQSEEENDLVQKLAKTVHPFHGFWIGLKGNSNKENAFEWTDGSSVDFTNWDPEDSDTNSYTHTYLHSSDGKWRVYTPARLLRFICKIRSQL